MKPYEKTQIPVENSLSKWMTAGVMQRLNQVQCVAEMIASYMEDIYDQLAAMESNMENMQEGIEEVQDEIEELSYLIEKQMDQERSESDNSCGNMKEALPF